ncbi:hypothetical protein HK101_007398, partial [Irineochytrium annulatum]
MDEITSTTIRPAGAGEVLPPVEHRPRRPYVDSDGVIHHLDKVALSPHPTLALLVEEIRQRDDFDSDASDDGDESDGLDGDDGNESSSADGTDGVDRDRFEVVRVCVMKLERGAATGGRSHSKQGSSAKASQPESSEDLFRGLAASGSALGGSASGLGGGPPSV